MHLARIPVNAVEYVEAPTASATSRADSQITASILERDTAQIAKRYEYL